MCCMTAYATFDGVRTPSMQATPPARFNGPVHAAGVELHDAVGVRQAAVTHAVVERIELDDVDARDQRLEDVAARGHRGEGRLDAGLRPAILELVAVGGGRPRPASHARCARRAPGIRRRVPGPGGEAGRGGGGELDETATVEGSGHGVQLNPYPRGGDTRPRSPSGRDGDGRVACASCGRPTATRSSCSSRSSRSSRRWRSHPGTGRTGCSRTCSCSSPCRGSC